MRLTRNKVAYKLIILPMIKDGEKKDGGGLGPRYMSNRVLFGLIY